MAQKFDQGQDVDAAGGCSDMEHMVLPYAHGCFILRSSRQKLVVRNKKFPNRHWLADDLNTARMICDELNCE